MSSNYEDIIGLSRPKSKHEKMPISNRAAQFSPFAALSGYDEAIAETARITSKKIELTNDEKLIINEKLNYLKNNKVKDQIRIEYFVNDKSKTGGAYHEVKCEYIKVDEYNKLIILPDKTKIAFSNILSITSPIFKE